MGGSGNGSTVSRGAEDVEDRESISRISLEGCDHVEATKNGVRLVLSTSLMESMKY
jgi:hypothetical protein